MDLLYFRSLYARLDECVGNMVWSVRRYNVVTHVKSCFLRMFLWERFSALALKSMEYLEDRQRRGFLLQTLLRQVAS